MRVYSGRSANLTRRERHRALRTTSGRGPCSSDAAHELYHALYPVPVRSSLYPDGVSRGTSILIAIWASILARWFRRKAIASWFLPQFLDRGDVLARVSTVVVSCERPSSRSR